MSCENGPAKTNYSLKNIHVMEINQQNFNSVWPYLLVSLKMSDIIAIDLELSGLGSPMSSRAKNIEDRYSAIREAAQTRSILSLGLAFFKLDNVEKEERRLDFRCQVFNILSLCSEPFTIEPEALEFLAKHSFDFNRLIETGVRYHPSNIKKVCPLRSLMTELLSHGAPTCLHNGLVDIAFLYHHFYSPLPESLGEFCNALAELFPTTSPLCDSKYLAEYDSRMSGSFLEYVFRKCQGDNVREAEGERWHLKIRFESSKNMMSSLRDAVEIVNCRLPAGFPHHPVPYDLRKRLCEQFSNHGFCRKQSRGQCLLLHDVDFALDLEYEKIEKERQKRKKRFNCLKPTTVLEKEQLEREKREAKKQRISVDDLKDKTRISVSGCHRAGVDAFMTGYAVLFQSRMSLCREGTLNPKHINRIPLSGKEQPFIIQSTQFAGKCAEHANRFATIYNSRTKIPPLQSVLGESITHVKIS